MRVKAIKNYCRLLKNTNANTSRGEEGGCEQSGCSRYVFTAAMGACLACRHTFLNAPSANNGSRRAGKKINTLEGGCTGNASRTASGFITLQELAWRCVGYLPQTFPR